MHRSPVGSPDPAQLLAADRRDAADLLRHALVSRGARRQLACQRRPDCRAPDPQRSDGPDGYDGLAAPGVSHPGSSLLPPMWSWFLAVRRLLDGFIIGDDSSVAVARSVAS